MKLQAGHDPLEAGCLARVSVCPTLPLLDMVGQERKPVKRFLAKLAVENRFSGEENLKSQRLGEKG
jgi:hypothetical protein